MAPERVLLLASTRAYHADDFAAAAERLGVEVMLGTDRCHVLAETWPEGALALDFRDPDAAVAAICARAAAAPIAGVVPTDDVTAVIAAGAATRLGLRHNPIAATRAAGSKLGFRRAATAAGLPQPRFVALAADTDPARVPDACAALGFPVVVKPLHLSASRGVMRADGADQLAARFARLAALLAEPEIRGKDPDAARSIVVESFVPGPEVALEGLLDRGRLATLAVFDKPDPLDGPFFAETLYVTPSRRAPGELAALADAVQAAADALGLVEGPIHAELRCPPTGPVVIELAARSIGGLCGRALRFGAGIALEELIIAHAIGRDVRGSIARERAASGVLMLPVPTAGVVRGVDGVDAARAIPGITDAVITARTGDAVVPLPEGQSYLGFVFARGDDPERVTLALRRAGAAIRFHIAPTL